MFEIINMAEFLTKNQINKIIVYDKLNKKLLGEIELNEEWLKTLQYYASNDWINIALTNEDKKRFDKEIIFVRDKAVVFDYNLSLEKRIELIRTLQKMFNWGKKVEYRVFHLLFEKYPLIMKTVNVNKIDENGFVEWI